jgi:hypothetical protein
MRSVPTVSSLGRSHFGRDFGAAVHPTSLTHPPEIGDKCCKQVDDRKHRIGFDALILPHHANPGRIEFSGTTGETSWRCIAIHRSLHKDAPCHRAIQRLGAITSHSLSSAEFITNIADLIFGTFNRLPGPSPAPR